MILRHLDLFSGVGGFALGLESTGHFQTVAFCEIEEYPRRVLAKHWPEVPCYEDVRDVTADRLAGDGIGEVGIVTGGFPCQDISLAGARAGLSGERSGLWSELLRVCAEVRPRWLIAENVVGLRTLGADRVLADLAGAGYSAWPLVVGAGSAGASHKRPRVWMVAHLDGGGRQRSGIPLRKRGSCKTRVEFDWSAGHRIQPAIWSKASEPERVLGGVVDGLPCGMDRRQRLRALGNAVVPQVVAALGRAIVDAEGR